jgi:signal peptidase I
MRKSALPARHRRAGAARTVADRGAANDDYSRFRRRGPRSISSPTRPSWTGFRRSRWIVALLSLLAPCAGHFYAGRPGRGVVLFVVLVDIQLMVVATAFLLPPYFSAVITFTTAALIVWVGYCLFVLVDAVRVARRRDGSRAASRWYVCGAAMIAVWSSLVAMGALSAAAKPLLPWQMFNVASASMEPTLRENEWLLADASYFKQNMPSRGDVVVYRLPNYPGTTFIKRVVAIAGDRVAFRDGLMFINGATVVESYVNVGDPMAVLNTTAEFVVPADHVFVAGDNRSSSVDSRTWRQHGPVPIANVIGRATELFLTDAPDRAGLWVGSPTS